VVSSVGQKSPLQAVHEPDPAADTWPLEHGLRSPVEVQLSPAGHMVQIDDPLLE